MTEYVLSIDPGISTGVALLSYEPDSAPKLEEAWQFTGGAMALKRWLQSYPLPLKFSGSGIYSALGGFKWKSPKLSVVAEKFTARNTKGYAYTTASMEPLRGEGVLIALDLMPDYSPKEKRWRDPGLQYLAGGKDLADKKKRQHKFLKDIGFYRTNKDFPDSPSKDGADDFRSAASHGLAYLAREIHHKPTFELLSRWEG